MYNIHQHFSNSILRIKVDPRRPKNDSQRFQNSEYKVIRSANLNKARHKTFLSLKENRICY
jgi:hypothetical protein